MKTFSRLTILIVFGFILISCDPINCAMIENKSKKNVELLIHVNSIDSIIIPNDYVIDTLSKTAKCTLKPNDEIVIAFGSRIAAPIMKSDIKFKMIEILIEDDTLVYNNSAFYHSLDSRTEWPFFAVRNWYYTIK